jgi:hypothetical protein
MPRALANLKVREKTPQDRLWNRLIDELESRDTAFAIHANQLVERSARSMVISELKQHIPEMIPSMAVMQIECVGDYCDRDQNGKPKGVCTDTECSAESSNLPPYNFDGTDPAIPTLVYSGRLLRWQLSTGGCPMIDFSGVAQFEFLPGSSPNDTYAFDPFGVLTRWYFTQINNTTYDPCYFIGAQIIVRTAQVFLKDWSWIWVVDPMTALLI